MVNPRRMCLRHLLGEHVETHMIAGHLRAGRRLGRFAADGLVEQQRLRERHDALAREIERRGYRHASPLPPFVQTAERCRIDRRRSLADLARRCADCRAALLNGRKKKR